MVIASIIDLSSIDILIGDLNHQPTKPPKQWTDLAHTHAWSIVAPSAPTFYHNPFILLHTLDFAYVSEKSQAATLIAADSLSHKHLCKELSDHHPVYFNTQTNNHHPDKSNPTEAWSSRSLSFALSSPCSNSTIAAFIQYQGSPSHRPI